MAVTLLMRWCSFQGNSIFTSDHTNISVHVEKGGGRVHLHNIKCVTAWVITEYGFLVVQLMPLVVFRSKIEKSFVNINWS